MKNYCLIFTKLSKHAPTMGADSRARIKKFVLRIFEHLDNLCWSTMLIPSMDVFPLMVKSNKSTRKSIRKLVGS